MSTALVPVSFHGDILLAARVEDRTFVSVRRVCDGLGLDTKTQLGKLHKEPWATVVIMTTVAEDGKQRQVAMLDTDGLPGWMFSINHRKIRENLRDKLASYQREAARVLRDHFFGPKQQSQAVVPGAWSQRLDGPTVAFRTAMRRQHPGWWSVLTEARPDLLVIEDEFVRSGLPLLTSDLPDGSIGKRYVNYRDGKPWALPYVQDIALDSGNLSHGQPLMVYPRIYQSAEREHFERWFDAEYLLRGLGEYASNKWGEQMPAASIAQAVTTSYHRLADGSANPILPPKLRKAQPALAGHRQMTLFGTP